MSRLTFVGLTAFMLFAGVPALADEPVGTLTLDAVDLIAGKETPGEEARFVDHSGHRYLFATDENKAAFLADPARYEIQMGGGCARMGPLSGACSLDRYTVHDGRLYVFASDACRSTFLKMPEKFLDPDESSPKGTSEEESRGREMIERAVMSLGGAERLDAARCYQARIEKEVEDAGKKVATSETVTVRFPDGYRSDSTWGEDYRWAFVTNGQDAWFIDSSGERSMQPGNVRGLEREHRLRDVLVLLRSRNQPGFVAVYKGLGAIRVGDADVPVENIAVGYRGTRCTLGLDPQTHRVLSITYRGRGPRMTFGELTKVFSDFNNVSGLSLPRTVTTLFDGKPVGEPVTYSSLTVDAELDPSLFTRGG